MSKSIYKNVCCIYCREERSATGLHTHVDRAHFGMTKYSSGNNGKYDEITKQYNDKRAQLEKEYLSLPKYCLQCNSVIEYRRRGNKFCNNSCSQKYVNEHRSESTRNKISSSNKGKLPWNTGKSWIIDSNGDRFPYCKVSFCKTCNKAISNRHMNTCSKACMKLLLAKLSSTNPQCGGRRNSIRIPYIDSFGKSCILESTYELHLANLLDKLKIKWLRPKHFNYHMNDKLRRYHPDFYLPDYDLYLDPKNDYLIKTDMDKISLVEYQNNIKVAIFSKNDLDRLF